MKFAIIISTYQRKDGKTPDLIKRTLKSIFEQKFTDYKIFLIGDNYENNGEFEEIVNFFPFQEKIFYKNLDKSLERDFFQNKIDIWKFGGVNATNFGIETAIRDGFKHIVRIDHDDVWYNNHLELIKQCIVDTGSSFICTKSKYSNLILPKIDSQEQYINFLPQPENLVHSTIYMDIEDIPVRYRTLGDTFCRNYAADGCLYLDIINHVTEKKLKSIMINQITCVKESDGYFKNS